MSLLDKVGAAIGVGNLEVTVECEEEIHRGDQVQGVVVIKGGHAPQIVQGLELALTYRWDVEDEMSLPGDEGSEELYHQPKPIHLEVEPGSEHRVPFVLDVPLDTSFAEPGDWHTIDVRADIPSAVDVTGSRRVTLQPPRRIADALRAITAAGWTLEGYDRKAQADLIRAQLSPGPAMEARFDAVYLEMALDKDIISVHATFDLKEKFWKEITGQDKHEHTFAAADVPALVARFQELVDKYSARS